MQKSINIYNFYNANLQKTANIAFSYKWLEWMKVWTNAFLHDDNVSYTRCNPWLNLQTA